MTKTQNQKTEGLTFIQCPTRAEAKQAFEAVEDKDRDIVKKVTYCLDYLCSSGRGSFTEADLFTALRQFDIEDFQEVRRLFKRWQEVMLSLSKITVIENAAYDEIIIVIA